MGTYDMTTRLRNNDLTGKRFGRLRVNSLVSSIGGARWLCTCACGARKVISRSALTRRNRPTRSCGCLQVAATRKHGFFGTPTYKVWIGLRSRCNDPRSTGYKWYGGAGIRVAKRWDTFINFLADVGERPTPRHSLDRIKNEHGYCKSNCRWVPLREQARNRTNNRRIKFAGITLILTEWAKLYGMSVATLKQRLDRGWSKADAFHTPVQAHTSKARRR